MGLMVGSGILFVRCLFDLAIVQRPLLAPNLTFGGLAWFGLALIVCLSADTLCFNERVKQTVSNPWVVSQQGFTEDHDMSHRKNFRRLEIPLNLTPTIPEYAIDPWIPCSKRRESIRSDDGIDFLIEQERLYLLFLQCESYVFRQPETCTLIA
jgi:hypothetical protein